jgi:hypothetical protein
MLMPVIPISSIRQISGIILHNAFHLTTMPIPSKYLLYFNSCTGSSSVSCLINFFLRLREQELNKHISQLEGRLSRETMRRLSLEEEVRNLREENRRLQQESQSAAQQLRRFTEWFFQTIDKQ